MSGEDGEHTFRCSPLRFPEAISPRPRPVGPDLGLDQLRTPVPSLSSVFRLPKPAGHGAEATTLESFFFF